MAHLGADVAAYVDGQLSEPAMHDAARHLESCEACGAAVRQQRLLKSRMSTVGSPEPPAQLLASLAGLAADPPATETWWERVRRSSPFRAGLVLAGASVVVVMAAYAIGHPDRGGDAVTPPYERYAADFFGATAVQAGTVISDDAMAELDEFGWPCHLTLAGDMQRITGAYTPEQGLALTYSDGSARLNVFQQRGVLEPDDLEGFEPREVAGHDVWVRSSDPLVVTWDDGVVVYTIVTDVDADRLAQAVSELPHGAPSPGTVERIGEGLNRLASWSHAA